MNKRKEIKKLGEYLHSDIFRHAIAISVDTVTCTARCAIHAQAFPGQPYSETKRVIQKPEALSKPAISLLFHAGDFLGSQFLGSSFLAEKRAVVASSNAHTRRETQRSPDNLTQTKLTAINTMADPSRVIDSGLQTNSQPQKTASSKSGSSIGTAENAAPYEKRAGRATAADTPAATADERAANHTGTCKLSQAAFALTLAEILCKFR